MSASCPGCGRAVRCICNRTHPVQAVLGPVEPVPAWWAYGGTHRATILFKGGAPGVLYHGTHTNCLHGCQRCRKVEPTEAAIKIKQWLAAGGSVEYNKFSSEH